MAGVIETKLIPPELRPGLIERPHLLEAFSQLRDRKATFLVAPAGYGKTTLLLQALHTGKIPMVWYRLDTHDNNLSLFVRHLNAGFKKHLRRSGQEIPDPLKPEPVPAQSLERSLVSSLVNHLAARVGDGLVIVLDNWHVVTEPSIHSFVKGLFLHLPAGIHIVIASRTSLPSSFSPLLIQGQAVVLGVEELRFNTEEIEAFVSRNLKSRHPRVSRQSILDFERMTGGWPTALTLLEDRSLRSSIHSDFFLPDSRR
ncbi:MAG: hypothetical protein GX795_01420, partial [Firmicutes bacterium]|nr:hypothetical protein [Bacillota bacterium]